MIEGLAIFFWPSVSPFNQLAAIHTHWVPFTITVVAGYIVVYLTITLILNISEEFRKYIQEQDYVKQYYSYVFIITISWLVIITLLGKLTYPLFLVAIIVLVSSYVRKSRLPPQPEPQPKPIPEPIVDGEDADRDDDEFYYRNFSWLFNEEPYRKSGRTKRFCLNIKIPKSKYRELLAKNHTVSSDSDYVEFANAQLSDDIIQSIVSSIRQIRNQQSYDDLDEIHLTMSYTLSMQYAYDDVDYGREYPKYPVEMLVDKKGDCEDFSILCGTLLYGLKYKVALILLSFTDSKTGHAALGIELPFSLPFPSFQIYSEKMNAHLVYCEVTPSISNTTKASTNVQWWLGMMDWGTAYNFRDYPIG